MAYFPTIVNESRVFRGILNKSNDCICLTVNNFDAFQNDDTFIVTCQEKLKSIQKIQCFNGIDMEVPFVTELDFENETFDFLYGMTYIFTYRNNTLYVSQPGVVLRNNPVNTIGAMWYE